MDRTERIRPPDVRGPTAATPITTFVTGGASLIAVLGGTIAVQIAFALAGGPLTPACRAELVTEKGEPLTGSLGVCHIIEGFRSPIETVLLVVGIALGIAAIVAGFTTFGRMPTRRQREESITGAVLGIQAVILGAGILWFRSGDVFTFGRLFLNAEVLRGSLGAFLLGAANTLKYAFSGELGGIAIGLVLALFALSSRPAVRAPARVYINFWRGTPLVWQLIAFHFLMRLGLGVRLSTGWEAIIVFSLNTGAYAAEVFRAGIQSIERGQMEAARSLGMSYLQAMRYAVVPQAIRRVIPPLMNEFVILIKDTSLVFVLGLTSGERELFTVGQDGFADTFNGTYYFAVAAGYLAITLPLIRLVNYVEGRLRSGLVGVA